MDLKGEEEKLKLIAMAEVGVTAMSEDHFRQLHKFHKPKQLSKWTRLKTAALCCRISPLQCFPIASWIREYSVSYFVGDLAAGLTTAILQVSHALAFAPLGGQPPVVGLYMAVFPPLAYIIFGTSRHLSIGMFAILIMMVGQVVEDHSASYSATEVCIAVSFLVGALQLVFGIARLGFVFVLFSDNLVSGFTCGAAVQILCLQFKYLLGIQPPNASGPLKILYNAIEIGKHMPETNFVALGISFIIIVVLACFNEIVKPKIAKRTKIPVPADFIIICIASLISYLMDLSGKYDVQIVGAMQPGLPSLVVPPFSLMPSIIVSCFMIAFVSASVSVSLSTLFAKKGGYVIDNNQELRAYGISNMFGSFFQSPPICGSISRTATQFAVGGKTQIASGISSLAGVSLLLFAGKVLEVIPVCALAAVVSVSLKGILIQAKDVPRIWRRGRLDGFVWFVTFGSVVVIDIDYGLAIGLAFSLLSLVIRGTQTQIVVLGKIPDQDFYVDCTYYETQSSVLILRIIGGINFANCHSVMLHVTEKFDKYCASEKQGVENFLILDFSAVTYVDAKAIDELAGLHSELLLKNCQIVVTSCSSTVFHCLERCEFFSKFPRSYVIVSITEALSYLKKIKGV